MNLKLEFDVTVTQHESGMYLAMCADFPRSLGVDETPEGAVASLKRIVATSAQAPKQYVEYFQPVPNPLLSSVGRLPDDELTREWLQCIKENREREDHPEPERE